MVKYHQYQIIVIEVAKCCHLFYLWLYSIIFIHKCKRTIGWNPNKSFPCMKLFVLWPCMMVFGLGPYMRWNFHRWWCISIKSLVQSIIMYVEGYDLNCFCIYLSAKAITNKPTFSLKGDARSNFYHIFFLSNLKVFFLTITKIYILSIVCLYNTVQRIKVFLLLPWLQNLWRQNS